MSLRVLLFARYADLLGHAELTVELPDEATVQAVVDQIRELPGGRALPATLLVAVNLEQADYQTRLRHGDEVAILPPVAGG